jgi:signal transduction histidine kinase
MDTVVMMELSEILPVMIGLTAVGGLALAGVLMSRVATAPGTRPLAVFCLLVGCWSVGLLLPDWRGGMLMATAPMGAAAFAHFSVRLGQTKRQPIWPAYAVAIPTFLAACLWGAGHFPSTPDFTFVYGGGAGLTAVGVTMALALWGQVTLGRAWSGATGLRRRQLAMVALSSTLGLLSLSGMAPPLVEIESVPWTLLALPLYLVGLVYAMLRYELMDVNFWARRVVTAAILVGLAAIASTASAGWLATRAGASFPWTIAALLVGLAMAAPLRRLADRIVFPGGEITSSDFSRWRGALAEAADERELDDIADRLLRERLGAGAKLVDVFQAPPGPRRVITTLTDFRTEAAREIARRREQAERKRLSELGMLAATVAHDLRNPMNIISMAAAGAPSDVRADIKTQLARMNALVRDLLDYAKPWRLAPQEVELASALASAGAAMAVETDISDGFRILADPVRLTQALANLLDNANAAGGKVCVFAERYDGGVLVHVCDDGQGVPLEIRSSLFRPFASRGTEGTGLGLAIVAKIMAAHGGEAKLGERPGWTTCFTLRFPG